MTDHALTDDMAELLINAIREELEGRGGKENPYNEAVQNMMLGCEVKPELCALLRLGRGDFDSFEESVDGILDARGLGEENEVPNNEKLLEYLVIGFQRRRAEDCRRRVQHGESKTLLVLRMGKEDSQ